MELLGRRSDEDKQRLGFLIDGQCVYLDEIFPAPTGKRLEKSQSNMWWIAVGDPAEKTACLSVPRQIEDLFYSSKRDEDVFSLAVEAAFANLKAISGTHHYLTSVSESDIDLNWPVSEQIASSIYQLWEAQPDDSSRQREFEEHARKWTEETAYASSATQIVLHPSYQRIIGMGKTALPFIFGDLQRSERDWFWALASITGENPVSSRDAGNVPEMIRAWLAWGRQHGYV